MGLKEDLQGEVAKFFAEKWETRDGIKVPESESLKLCNEAVKLTATVLYADLAESTNLVDRYEPYFAAEIYKSYLHCAAKIIKFHDGVITSYDGDRIMAIFIGGSKNTNAVKTGLKINWAVKSLINPAIKSQYPKNTYEVKQVVGIDTSELWVARTGVRGANDLVWVGRAANYAAKLTAFSNAYPTLITNSIYTCIADEAKLSKGVDMWTAVSGKTLNGLTVYGSTYLWSL